MRALTIPLRSIAVLATACCVSPLAAQANLVNNGSFGRGLTGWSMSGGGVDAKVETFDTTGLGASSSFGVNAGKGATGPNPPLILAQSVTVTRAASELYMDLSLDAPAANNDAGTIVVKLGGTEVARKSWGKVPQRVQARDILCVRFVPKLAGRQTLAIEFQRQFQAARGRTPRLWIDNVSLFRTPGPTFCWRGHRRPGQFTLIEVLGVPQTAFGVLVAARPIRATPIQGFDGVLRLDPATVVVFFSAPLDQRGKFRQQLRIPNQLGGLVGVSLFYQPIAFTARPAFGIMHNYGLQR